MEKKYPFPVFVLPQSIKFKLNGKTNHKELFTVYNPYGFAIKYKIYSTCSFKYSISDPEGEIQPDSSVDIIVRHNAPTISNCGTIDKFRINTCDIITEKITGRKSIEVILLECEDEIATESSARRTDSSSREQMREHNILVSKKSFVFIATIAAIAMLVWLPLKDTGEKHDSLPDYLHLTCISKIAVSFLIGAISTYHLFSFHNHNRALTM